MKHAKKHLTGFPGAKTLSAAALALLLDGYTLIADPDSKSLWCAASIGEDARSPLVKRVLKTCAPGSHCHIEGAFTGHGLFFWTRISSVSLLKR
jgi:hypothetical protein